MGVFLHKVVGWVSSVVTDEVATEVDSEVSAAVDVGVLVEKSPELSGVPAVLVEEFSELSGSFWALLLLPPRHPLVSTTAPKLRNRRRFIINHFS